PPKNSGQRVRAVNQDDFVNIPQALFIALFPAAVILLQKRVAFIRTIGPVVLCYAAGILAGLLFMKSLHGPTSQTLTEVAVPLAIPLMLFSLNLKAWLRLAPSTVLSFGFALISI